MKALLLMTLLLGACLGSAPETVYYVLEAPAASPAVAQPRSSAVLVRRFATAPGYDRNELVYRAEERQLRLYDRDLWAARPGRVVSDAIAEHLTNARLFGSVITKSSAATLPEYELRGEVLVIDARKVDKDWVARLEVHMELIAIASEKVLWSHDIESERAMGKRTPGAMVAALDAILADELGRMTASMDEALPR